jgi:hypothetical protein
MAGSRLKKSEGRRHTQGMHPYMSGRVAEVADAVFFMRFHVPWWAIAQVFGRDARYWYRLQRGFGRFSLVGTTVKTAAHLPADLVADEKHSWLKGDRVYIATTAARDCLLGAAVAPSASQADRQAAYGRFAQEATALDPAYTPQTPSIPTAGPRRKGPGRRCFPRSQASCVFCMPFSKSGLAPPKPYAPLLSRSKSGCGRPTKRPPKGYSRNG